MALLRDPAERRILLAGALAVVLMALLGPVRPILASLVPAVLLGPWLAVVCWRQYRAADSEHLRRSALWVGVAMTAGLSAMPLIEVSPKSFAVSSAAFHAMCAIGCATLSMRRMTGQQDPLLSRQVVADAIQMWVASCMLILLWLVFRNDQTVLSPWLVGIDVVGLCGLIAMVGVSTARDPNVAIRRMGLGALVCLLGALGKMVALLQSTPLWPAELITVIGWMILVIHLGRYRNQPITALSWAEAERAGVRYLGAVNLCLYFSIAASLTAVRLPWIVVILLFLTIAAQVLREQFQLERTMAVVAEQIRFASLDPLTELPNRRALQLWTDSRLSSPVDNTSVITIDLDDFKDINDLLGHSVGDQVLRTVGRALQRSLQSRSATSYRVGGDEFTIVANHDLTAATELARQVIEEINTAAGAVDGVGRLGLTASAGVSYLETGTGETVAALILESGHAMRAAKAAGKGRVHVFDQSLLEGYRRRKLVEVRLREQLADVALVYQPIVAVDHLGGRRVTAYEALARWQDDILGVVSPLEFIAVAEDTGLIQNLGRHLLRRALLEMSETGLLTGDRQLSVNASALQLRAPDFVDGVLDALSQSAVEPQRLIVEVTESNHIEPDGPSNGTLSRLADSGISLAIDDFGAGQTSVSYLARLPIHVVKLDRSLTGSMGKPGPTGIIRGMVEMCRGLELRVVLEGVETATQELLAVGLGVDRLQGWLDGMAVPAAELAAVTAQIETGPRGRAGDQPISAVPLARRPVSQS